MNGARPSGAGAIDDVAAARARLWRGTAIAVLVLAALAGALRSDWLPLVRESNARTWAESDLEILWVGGRALVAGLDFADARVTTALGLRLGRTPITPICYSHPLVLRMFGEWSSPDFFATYRAWRAVNLALIAACVGLVAVLVGRRVPSRALAAAIALVVVLGNDATWASLYYNQLNLVALTAMLGAAVAARREHQGLEGTLIAIAACAKISPALLAVAALAAGRRRAAGVAAVLGAAMFVVSLAWNGGEVHARYLSGTLASLGYASTPEFDAFNSSLHAWNLAPNGFFSRAWLPSGDGARAAAAAWGVTAVVLAALVRLARGRDPFAVYALATTATFLVSSMTWPHHLVFAALPVAWLASRPAEVLAPSARALAALAVVALFVPMGTFSSAAPHLVDVYVKAAGCAMLFTVIAAAMAGRSRPAVGATA